MAVEILKTLFTRDLTRLRNEIESYKNEKNLWKIEKNIANSAGNLCLHLIGNLNTYIGNVIGKTEYVRNRDLEFSLKDVPRKDLLDKIDETTQVLTRSLDMLDEKSFQEQFPIRVFEQTTSIEYMLTHLTTHLAYHLGQINYHRRLMDN